MKKVVCLLLVSLVVFSVFTVYAEGALKTDLIEEYKKLLIGTWESSGYFFKDMTNSYTFKENTYGKKWMLYADNNDNVYLCFNMEYSSTIIQQTQRIAFNEDGSWLIVIRDDVGCCPYQKQ